MAATSSPVRAIITGASGMVGEGVLIACLKNPAVEKILVLGRRSCGITHPKLSEILHPDFMDIHPLAERLKGYNACFFCLGVSSVGMKEDVYYRQTYTLTMHVAAVLAAQNPGMNFCYVSGTGTDSSEKGRSMWARIKGKTENDLHTLGFKAVFAFRPGIIEAAAAQKNLPLFYRRLRWLMKPIKSLFPAYVCNVSEIAAAMVAAVSQGYGRSILEIRDIKQLALASRHENPK